MEEKKVRMKQLALDRMKKKLDLSDDQTAKLNKILDVYQNEMLRIVQADAKLSESKARFQEARETRDDQISTVLSPDQFRRYKQMKHQFAPPPPPGDEDPGRREMGRERE